MLRDTMHLIDEQKSPNMYISMTHILLVPSRGLQSLFLSLSVSLLSGVCVQTSHYLIGWVLGFY